VATETYRQFRRALRYLTEDKGLSANRVIGLAEDFGYAGFANLAPPSADPGDGADFPSIDHQRPTGTQRGPAGAADTWTHKVIADYQRAEGAPFDVVRSLGEATSYVFSGSPPLSAVRQRVREKIKQRLHNVKHFVAMIGALAYRQQLTQSEKLRRGKLTKAIREEIRDHEDLGADDKADVTAVVDLLEQTAREWTKAEQGPFGTWIAKSLSVQPSQVGIGAMTDWIELPGYSGGWGWPT